MEKGEKTTMKKGKGKRKIPIQKIENSQSRLVSFSKRRQGLFKKAKEFSSISGTQIGILVESQAGRFYTYGSPASFDSVAERFLQETNMDEPMPEKKIESELGSAESSGPKGIADYGVLEPWRFWLDLDVDSYDNVEDLMRLMNDLKELMGKVGSRQRALELGSASACLNGN